MALTKTKARQSPGLTSLNNSDLFHLLIACLNSVSKDSINVPLPLSEVFPCPFLRQFLFFIQTIKLDKKISC